MDGFHVERSTKSNTFLNHKKRSYK